MELIYVKLVEVDLNGDGNFIKYLRLENDNSYEFIRLPDLSQISFYKNDYKKLIDEGKLVVKEYSKQPQITYMV